MTDRTGPKPRPWVTSLPRYVPGISMDRIAREYGLVADGIVRLSSNENALGPSPAAVEAVRAGAGRVNLYPDGACTALRESLAKAWGVGPDWITMGNGSSEVIENACAAYVGPGDEAAGFEYGFALFEKAALSSGGGFREAPTAHGFRYDVEALVADCVPPVRVVFVANPNNPTGSYLDEKALLTLLERVPDDVLVVIDEAYHGFAARAPLPDVPDGIEILKRSGAVNLLVTRSFSKIHGLAGLRIGAGIAHPAVIEALDAVRSPINVNSVAQAACLAALSDASHLSESRDMVARGREFLTERLDALPVTVHGDAGNFLMVDLGRPAEPVIESMARDGVFVRGLAPYGLDDCLRVTVGTPPDCDRFLSALTRALG